MIARARTATLAAAAAGVLAFAGAAVGFYRPPGDNDRARALETLKRALHALDDETLTPPERVVAYRNELASAERLLCLAIRRSPVDTASIERLALVRWESETLSGRQDAGAVPSLMDVAAARAPRVPEIQANLGDLLLKMGRPAEAVPYLRRAVELSPSMTNRAVAALAGAGMAPGEIVDKLPPDPEVLVATRPLFIDSGAGRDYLDRIERRLDGANPPLVMAYGEACLQLGAPGRLKDAILALPPTEDPAVRAERACQAAHGWLALGEAARALTAADEARQSAPFDPRLTEFYGEVALAAGQGAQAEAAFRRALELVLTDGAEPVRRARLYDALGRSLEAQGRLDIAYDAFRRAVELDPSTGIAAQRLAAYEHRSTTPQP